MKTYNCVTVFSSKFIFMTHFEYFKKYNIKNKSDYNLNVWVPSILASFLKKYSFPPLNCFCTVVGNQLVINISVYF
jgi:hypothetical protein